MYARALVLALGLFACSEAAPDPVSDAGDTSMSSGSETGASGTGDTGTSTGTEPSTTTGGSPDTCQTDSDCPGTQVCDMPSIYPNSCIACSECCSKVGCPEGSVCEVGSHHNSNGECVLECQPLDGPCGQDDDCCEGLACEGEGPLASCQVG